MKSGYFRYSVLTFILSGLFSYTALSEENVHGFESVDGENQAAIDCQSDPYKCTAFHILSSSGFVTNCSKIWQETGHEVYGFDQYNNVYHKVNSRIRELAEVRQTSIGELIDHSRLGAEGRANAVMKEIVVKSGASPDWRDIPVGIRRSSHLGSEFVPIKYYAVRVHNKLINRFEWVIFGTFIPKPYDRSFQYSNDTFSLASKELVRQCYPLRPHNESEKLPSIFAVINLLNASDQATKDAKYLDKIFRGMVTFIKYAPVTGEVSVLYRGCYLKESSCMRASILAAASAAGYVMMAGAKSAAFLGNTGYMAVTTVGAGAAVIDGGFQGLEAIRSVQKGEWGDFILHGSFAALRFSGAKGLVLEAAKSYGSVGGLPSASASTGPSLDGSAVLGSFSTN
jgi:hypothetical protein